MKLRIFEGKGQILTILGIIVTSMVLWSMSPMKEKYFRLLFAFGLALIITGIAEYETMITVRWPAALLLMGNASYSIYLVHNPLLSVTQRMTGYINMSWATAMVIGVGLSIFMGWIYHLKIELKLQNWTLKFL